MRKHTRLREIYAELRRCVGSEVAAGDLVRLALHILNAYSGDDKGEERLDFPSENRAFFSLPVDVAMRDGGWQIYFSERHRAYSIDDLNADGLALIRRNLDKLLGAEWQRLIPPG